ncbi:CSLREA domain-containing protein [Alkanindiges illinoisensis]|uniref:CSLREA domain-containing protein n=1 Tax=Alkanindiges illinoisensis TaxID=197183 RepID=UPI000479C1A5|nr:CSLREA domain-containing protein [Alkanindiges illinoisensis]
MYRKSLLALVVLAALPVTAATDRTLYVSTFEDEDGENANACSLREAIQAATTNRAYGGCIAGQLDLPDQLQLKAGTYNLKKPLVIGSNMAITGGDAANFEKEDPYIKDVSRYPARSKLETTIQPADGLAFTLFDSTTSRSALDLNKVILKNGKSSRGGAIRAGGTINLSRVRISNSSATDVGGAIYLEGSSANLSVKDSLFDSNTANRGAVIGMSCLDNVALTQHSIKLERTSIYGNGSSNTQSIIDYCGTVVSTITASTIAKNQSSSNIIKYVHSNSYPLHPSSTLDFISDTIVENSGTATLYYDNVGKLSLAGSVIAYNSINTGKSCSYALGAKAAAKLESSQVVATYNALTKPGTARNNVGECDLPGHLYKTTENSSGANETLRDLMPDSLSRVLAPLYLDNDMQVLESEQGLFPAYIPLITASASETLIDQGLGSCSPTDQRGLQRIDTSSGNTATTTVNICDVGAIEVSKLTAADLPGISNSSLVTPITQYEDNIEYYEDIYNDKTLDSKLVNRYKKLINNEKKELEAFKKSRAYRQAYANVLDSSTEDEQFISTSNGLNTEIKKFGDDFDKNYNITVTVVGRGSDQFIESKDSKDINIKAKDSNIVCSWDKDLKQVLIRRTDNSGLLAATTPAGEYEYCKYTITSKINPVIKSEGYVQARIVNIAPIAEDDEYKLVYGSSQPIKLDILKNDSDEGDGTADMAGYPKGYPSFYQDPINKSYANIKLVTKPTLGKLNFEYEQPCPDNSNTRPEETCYGGKITYTPNSTFSTFNDSFTYKVLDQDKAESKEATVKIINTATTSDDTRGSGGGGAIGVFGLLGLASLIWIRRKIS